MSYSSISKLILGQECEPRRKSCFMMALKSARYNLGRNISTGEVIDSNDGIPFELLNRDDVFNNCMLEDTAFTGLLTYLILIDQIGSIFTKSMPRKRDNNGFKEAIKTFSTITCEEDIDAIYQLRCSLAHSFGLVSNKRKNKNEHRKFSLSFVKTSPIVRHPITEWESNYADKSDDTSTIIGVYALCDEIEYMIQNIINMENEGTLLLKKPEEEIKSCYTIIL